MQTYAKAPLFTDPSLLNEKLELIDYLNRRLNDKKFDESQKSVNEIVTRVRKDKDQALLYFNKVFDRYSDDIRIDIENTDYTRSISDDLRSSLYEAQKRIEIFHQKEFDIHFKEGGWSFTGDLNENLGVRYSALDSVAIYVPGGGAPLISTVLMTAIPAKIAGVRRIVLLSPPEIPNEILAAAQIAGVTEAYNVGGAQAIAAAAYGTSTIKAVDKIVGPGNIYVSLAKKQCMGKVGIDGFFGPSELAIIADKTANPRILAADFLSQLEHGSGLESALLLSDSAILLEETYACIQEYLKELRAYHKTEEQIKTIEYSLKHWSSLLLVDDLDEAVKVVNYYAPEHLEIICANANEISSKIKNAGAIFVGQNSCESLGDYLAGPSHCLPTGGSAKFSSGLQVADFIKKTSIVDFSNVKQDAFKSLIEDVANIARAEKLEVHAKSMEWRLDTGI